MKSIFEEASYKEILGRLDQLHENSARKWGKMTVGQMVWHCQFPFIIGIKNKNKGNGNIFARLFFKKAMYNDRLWRKNLPTLPELKTKEPKDFYTERNKLATLVNEFYALSDREEWNPHPIFGKFTKDQWGKMEYKHLDHHLTQFGV
ncbi:MAG: DUF1569 domain-containing protein [Flavobacteriaceae bacterium]